MNTPTISATDAEKPYFVGVDVGGTSVKLGLLDNRGRTIAPGKYDNETTLGKEVAIERMAKAIGDLVASTGLAWDDIPIVGLATPGTMDLKAGMILDPPNMPGWEQFPIRDRLSEAIGKPVLFSNDATAAGFGEYWVGSGDQYGSLVLMTLGTGVGAGIIIDGRTIDGHHSHGSENGHTLVDLNDNARICGCGQPGHLEAYASATALVKRAKQWMDGGRVSTLSDRLRDGELLTTLMLSEEAEKGDALSLEVILEGAKYLAIGIVNVVHIIDPEVVVLGGAMNFGGESAPIGKQFIERVRQEFRGRTFPFLAERTKIGFAQLGGDSGYIGSAGIARESFLSTTH
jgi:glucokinase